MEVNGGSRERLGIGLVGFTGDDLVDEAIQLRPSAIVRDFAILYTAGAGDFSEWLSFRLMQGYQEEMMTLRDSFIACQLHCLP